MQNFVLFESKTLKIRWLKRFLVFEGNKTTNALSMNPVIKAIPTSQDSLHIPPNHPEIPSASPESVMKEDKGIQKRSNSGPVPVPNKRFRAQDGDEIMLHQDTSTTPFLTPPDSVISSPQKYRASHQAHSGKISVKKAKLALDKMAAKSADISSKVCKSKSVISKVDETR